MRTLASLAGVAVFALAGFPAQATDFGPLMNVVHTTWPEKTHIGVVANYRVSREAIENLAAGAGEGCTITVLDVTGEAQLDKACNLLLSKVRPDYMVLLPEDTVVWDGSFAASRLVNRVASRGIPSIATTPLAIRQGAAFAMGEATGFELLETTKLIGTIEVIMPQKGTAPSSTASFHPHGSARIALISGS